MYIKPSLMAENDASIQHANRQSDVNLGKTINHMNKLEKQMANKSAVEQKFLRRRLKMNLERSLQTENKLQKIKTKLPHHPKTSSNASTIFSIKAAWEEETLKRDRRNSAPSTVIVPTAINLLVSNGYHVENDVIQKFVKLQQFAKLNKTSSLPNFSKLNASQNSNRHKPHPPKSVSRKHPREYSESQSSTSSSCKSTARKHKRIESEYSPPRIRPITAPELKGLKNSDKGKATLHWVKSQDVTSKNGNKNQTYNGKTRREESSDQQDKLEIKGLRIYKEKEDGLLNLHMKLANKMEEIDVIDIHRAQMASRQMSRRISSLMSDMDDYKLPPASGGKSPGMSVDYYSYCMRKDMEEKQKIRSFDVTDTSCMITSLSSMASQTGDFEEDDNPDKEKKSEIYYYDRVCQSMGDIRNQSLTVKSLKCLER